VPRSKYDELACAAVAMRSIATMTVEFVSVCFFCPFRYRNYSKLGRDKHHDKKRSIVFTARRYASAVYAMALCPSVSVTSRCSTKTEKYRIKQTTPHDSPGNVVF